MSADNIEKAPDAYRTISEVADDLDIPQHVLRFWETRFSQIRPLKRGGGRRYYRPEDVALIKGIRALLYGQGYTIKGVQRILRDQGLKQVQALGRGGQAPEPAKADLVLESAPAPELEMEEADIPAYSRDVDPGDSVEADTRPPLRAPAPADTQAGARFEEPLSVGQAASAAPRLPALDGESRRRLEAALAELIACRRMIAAARETA